MRKLLALIMCAVAVFSATARPAHRMPVVTSQPDGSQVTLTLCGDEFYHFSTTTDGYTVMKNAAGYWVYAQRDGNVLKASNIVAHDADKRSTAESALLANTPRRLTDRNSVANAKKMRSTLHAPSRANFDVSQFRGLIILIKPNDINFTMEDNTVAFYNTIVNQQNMTNVGFGNYGTWTGSVRDYYYDNSMGQFDPVFDIVGPVSVNYNANQIGNNYRWAFQSALRQIDSQVDYTQYDGNNDGKVDMVFFLVAGNTAAVQGNESLGYLWPHMSEGIGQGTYDGKRISLYACSTELNGSVSSPFVDGIGTICHEFTHVLGFPDLYDADYDDNGRAHDPGQWDIMAGGTDLNYGRTPAGYSIFERYAFGFATPQVINTTGSYTLNELSSANEGYILRTPQNKEFFIMENRQKTAKWDRYLPGHGMLVTRVDSTNAYMWVTNQVNNYSSRMYYELLRAGNTTVGDLASDPFPGSLGVPNITNTTHPSLLTYSGKQNAYSIMGITETNGVITFDVIEAGTETTLVETFNKIGISEEVPYEDEGDIATWRLAQCQIAEVEDEHVVAMKNPSVLQMLTPIYYNTSMVTFDITNTSSETAKLGLYYSVNGGSNWTAAKTMGGASSLSVPKMTSMIAYWKVVLENTQPAMFRVTMTGGSKNSPCYVDNFTVYYSGEPGGAPAGVRGDIDGNGLVDVEDVNAAINIVLKLNNSSDYPGSADLDGNGIVDVEDVNAIINIILKL